MKSHDTRIGAVGIDHVENSSPPAFKLTRLFDTKSLTPVAIASPYKTRVEGRPDSDLMRELRWYLEHFLDYPFHPEIGHAEHVLDALKAWGTQAFNALFDRRDAGDWLAGSSILQIRSDDPCILSWPWEALLDPQAGSYLAHQHRVERRPNRLPDPLSMADLPGNRVNILLVVARPYEEDVRYRSVARPLIELIQSRGLPAHVDVLRPPTFDQLRDHLRAHPGYYHVLHFDGHGAYGDGHGQYSPHRFRALHGCLVFENEAGEPDPKSASDLSVLLREYAVPAVVLNACQSATLDEKAEDAFATVATALLQSGMRSVVAMAYSLYVSGAQVFLPAFYRRLFESGSVAEAVRAGRQQMLANKNRVSACGPYPLEDWLLPVLYQQDPLDFHFATQAKLEIRESRLPTEVRGYRDEYGFVGRDGVILEMERALHRKAPCILVQGLGGVGKTTLARGFLSWLDETGGLDRALWFDFREIRTAEYVLNRTGEVFYGENFGAASNKLELLARALKKNRVLMVWDNFESAAENLIGEDRTELGRFLDVIRDTRGKVIITSCSREEWLGPSRRFELGLRGLDGEERWEYCDAILRELGLKVKRDDPELSKLINQLAGHPLAMRVVLPKLEHMPAAKVAEALRTNLAELGLNEQEEQSRLFATLRFVEQGLPEELRPLLGLVGLHEAYVDADYLEAMAKQVNPNWTRSQIDQLLAALSGAGLVREIGNATCEMHPLLTSYLRSQSAPEACQHAFVDIMGSVAYDLVPRPHHDQRIPFLLYGANFRFARHLSEKLDINKRFVMLTQSIGVYAVHSREFIEASRLFAQLAQYAAARADSSEEAAAYHQLGIVAAEQRDFQAAQDWYLKSLAISEKLKNLEFKANTCYQLGRVEHENRNLEAARDWYVEALSVSEGQDQLQRTTSIYHEIGNIAQEQEDFESAREWYLKSLAISEKLGDLYSAANTYHELGIITYEQEDFETAREWYLKSLAISERQGSPGSANAYHGLGNIAWRQRDFETAREWFLNSITLSERLGNLHGAALSYQQLGRISQEQGDLETARGWHLKSLAILEKIGDPQNAARSYDQLGRIAEERRDFKAAQEYLLKFVTISEQLGKLRDVAVTYHELGIIAQEQGDFETAREWYLKSLTISEEQGNLHDGASAYHQLGIIAAEQRDFDAAREWFLTSLSISENSGKLRNAARTYGELGVLAALQGRFEESGRWLTRSSSEFQRMQDQHAMERNSRNFLLTYQLASPGDKEKLTVMWQAAGLGRFPA